MALSVIIIMITAATLMLIYRKKIYNEFRFRKMISKLPTVPRIAYPLIGHSYLFVGDPKEFFHFLTDTCRQLIAETKQKFTVLWLGPVPLVGVLHPDTAEVILKSSKHMEKSFVYRFLHPWLGTGLLTSNGEKWKQRRRLITPTFHFNILQDFLEVMNDQSMTMINNVRKQLESGEKIDISKSVTVCALDIICETAMGQSVNVQSDQDSEYVKALHRLSVLIQLRQKTPTLWWDFAFKKMKIGREHDEIIRTLHSFTKGVIQERMKTKKSKNDVSRRMAFLDVLMHASTEDGKELSLSDIQEEVDTFMFEGHDTTAAAMTWAIYLIGRHPDVQRRIQEELADVFGKGDRLATMEDLRQLNYLEQVIKESLRLYPSVPLLGRVTTEDCEVDGHCVPKGTQAVIFVYSILHSEEVWDDPERFDPDRFTTENCANRHPFAYIPFSAGPRNCIGQRFALQEEKVILSQLLRRFTVTSHDEREDVGMVGDLILWPAKTLNITLEEISP